MPEKSERETPTLTPRDTPTSTHNAESVLGYTYPYSKAIKDHKIYSSRDYLFAPYRPAPNQDLKTYYLANLDKLISKLKQYPEDSEYNESQPDFTAKYAVNYLVTSELQILFNRTPIPESRMLHDEDLSSNCIASGTIYFDRNFQSIILIDHQSRCFRPSAESIIWPVLILSHPGLSPFNQEDLTLKLNNCELLIVNKAKVVDFFPSELNERIRKANSSTQKYYEPCAYVPREATSRPSTPRTPRRPDSPEMNYRNEADQQRLYLLDEFIAYTKRSDDIDSDDDEMHSLETLMNRFR